MAPCGVSLLMSNPELMEALIEMDEEKRSNGEDDGAELRLNLQGQVFRR